MSVLDDAIWIMTKKPTGISRTAESHSVREKEKRIKATPKLEHATAIQRPRPLMVLRMASVTAPHKAPTPEQPIRIPRALGTSVEYLVGKYRHQHGVRHGGEADQPKQQHERADGPCAAHKFETFDHVLQRRALRGQCGDDQSS